MNRDDIDSKVYLPDLEAFIDAQLAANPRLRLDDERYRFLRADLQTLGIFGSYNRWKLKRLDFDEQGDIRFVFLSIICDLQSLDDTIASPYYDRVTSVGFYRKDDSHVYTVITFPTIFREETK